MGVAKMAAGPHKLPKWQLNLLALTTEYYPIECGTERENLCSPLSILIGWLRKFGAFIGRAHFAAKRTGFRINCLN
jgi:hypothetical protein